MKTFQHNTICLLLLLACTSPGNAKNIIPKNKENLPPVYGSNPYGIAITDFTLVDPQTNRDLYLLREGAIINKAKDALMPLNIRANEIDFQQGIKVVFDLQGPISHQNEEWKFPYALFGDSNGAYYGKVFPSGNYFLRASAYSVDSSGNAVLINEINLAFLVGQETNELTGINLIDADFDTDLDLPSGEYHIQEGRVFDTDNYPFYIIGPREISIKARTNSYYTGSVYFSIKGPINYSRTENTEPLDKEAMYLSPYLPNTIDQGVIPTNFANLAVYPSFPETGLGSVFLELSGPVTFSRTEHIAPYALFGDVNYDYAGRLLPAGHYLLKATPYTGPNRSGLAGQGYWYDFEIVAPRTAESQSMDVTNSAPLIWPNPAKGVSEIWIVNTPDNYAAALYNFNGEIIRRFPIPGKNLVPLDISTLKKGYYILRFTQGDREVITKILVVE